MRFPVLISLIYVLTVAGAAPSAEVILNEYNAVSGSNQLDGGDGKDSFFGTIDGNGGNWFELLVIEDHVDMRGWTLAWAEDETVGGGDETAVGVISLSSDVIWSDLRSGSIVTFSETSDGDGAEGIDTSTDTSYDPLAGDWWINISTQEEQAKGASALSTTATNDGVPGDFSVGKDDWTITIRNAANETIFGPAGEGIGDDWAGGGVGSEEGGSLEGPVATADTPLTLDVWRGITPSNEFYDDTGSTSFGAPNADYDAINDVFETIQNLSALRNRVVPPAGVAGDFDEDGVLTANDIDLLSVAVRTADMSDKFDVDENGLVDDADRETWVNELKKTYFGDANLDGAFNSSDLVAVLRAGEYEDAVDGNSTWATGDWNGDGDFTSGDFVTALTAGGYEQGVRTAVFAAVPEPASLSMTLVPLLCWAVVRRRNR